MCDWKDCTPLEAARGMKTKRVLIVVKADPLGVPTYRGKIK